MAIDSKTPLALYKANLELVLRLGTLLQENRRRWNVLGTSGASDAIERTLAETERLLTTNDWSSLSEMPGERFWRSIRDGGSPLHGTAEAALANQTAFADGLREAFSAWKQQSVDALGEGGLPLGKFDIAGFMNLFQGSQATVAAPALPTGKTKRGAAKKSQPKAARAPGKKKASGAPASKKAGTDKSAAPAKKTARKSAKSKSK